MDLIIDDIKCQLNKFPESKLVVTGLDRSGKSTFLNNFSEFRRYKDNYGIRVHPGVINWQFRVFDRHPSIETYVYTKGRWSGDDKLLLKHCIKSIGSFTNSVFLFFLYPKFRILRLDDEVGVEEFDELYIKRYNEVANAILTNIEGSIVIKIEKNLITRYQNDK